MRTTIEIADDKLVKLKKLAAERGEKGFSVLVDEALERYFGSEGPKVRNGNDFQDPFEGIWGEDEAEAVRARIQEDRKHWR